MTAQDRQTSSSIDHGRKEPRKKAFLTQQTLMAECHTAEGVFCDRVHNLSANGVFLETGRRLQIGQEIALTIALSDSKSTVVKATGEVVRITPKGVGVAFKIVFNY